MARQDPGETGGTDASGGSITLLPIGGSISLAGSGGSTAATTGGSGSNTAHPILKSGETATGCNCRAAGESSPGSMAWLTIASAGLGFGALRRRRRR
jgi:MYXO-CTERM domain-containing protein